RSGVWAIVTVQDRSTHTVQVGGERRAPSRSGADAVGCGTGQQAVGVGDGRGLGARTREVGRDLWSRARGRTACLGFPRSGRPVEGRRPGRGRALTGSAWHSPTEEGRTVVRPSRDFVAYARTSLCGWISLVEPMPRAMGRPYQSPVRQVCSCGRKQELSLL